MADDIIQHAIYRTDDLLLGFLDVIKPPRPIPLPPGRK